MLVSHRNKFIYTKTVKTGGTSVESYFEIYCMPPGEWEFSGPRAEYESESGIIGYRGSNNNFDKWYNHMPALHIKNNIGEKIWNDYFKFCVIRNPFEKVLSAFFHFYIHKHNVKTDEKAIISLFHDYIISGKGLVFDRDKYTIDNQICVDFFIKHESLEADLQLVCERINIPFQKTRLPRLKSQFRPSNIQIKDFFNQKTERIVREAYDFEFKYFGYKDYL